MPAKKSPSIMPQRVEPMLATLAHDPVNKQDWIYEIKWDGYRVLAYVDKGSVKLSSRNGLDYTKTYSIISEALSVSPHQMIIDGEIVLLNAKGVPDFDALQAYKGEGELVYYVFDIIYANGKDVSLLPLTERKNILHQLYPESATIRFSESFEDGIELYRQAEKLGFEGVVGKKSSSIYEPGKRSKHWLKYPIEIREEYVIGGWTESGRGRAFRSLLFGYYENKKLIYLGHAGLGYRDKKMSDILARLKQIESTKNPFTNEVEAETKVHWVKPILVAQIKYATLTKSGKIRKPAIFLGFRDDKKIAEVAAPVDQRNSIRIKKTTGSDSNWPKIETQEITSRDTVEIDGKKLELTNVERHIWKEIPKANLIAYYHSVSKYILPHIRHRPQSMHLKTIGATRPGFYIKDMEGRGPDWIETFQVKRKHKKEGKRDNIDYLVCNDEATLLYMVNLGCIDINPWTSTTMRPLEPDYIVIDLDPSDDDFKKVITTAKAAQQLFGELSVKSFIKTSGKSGMHLFLPVRQVNFKQARAIAVKICEQIHRLVPSITTTEISVDHRGSKLYIDPNQNDEADTVAAVYSARPWHLPTVSTPLEWKEVKESLEPADFTIQTILKRIEKKGELFAAIDDTPIANQNQKKLIQLLNSD
jgi:bifunctional non-homologous end joining protein LigD